MKTNFKSLIKKITSTALITVLLLSFIQTKTFAINFDDPNPNCKHEHKEETFSEPAPCELGDHESTLYVYCKDCGGLLEEKIGIKKSIHGKESASYVDEEGIKRCHMCDRPIEEKVNLKDGVIKKEEIERYMQIRNKAKTDFYPVFDYNKEAYKTFIEKSNKGIQEIENGLITYTKFKTGKNQEIEPLDFSKLDENFICKGKHRHLLVDFIQTKNLNTKDASLDISYICLDCSFNENIVYTKSQIDTVEKRIKLANENSDLKEFWTKLNLLDKEDVQINNSNNEKVDTNIFLDTIRKILDNIKSFFNNIIS